MGFSQRPCGSMLALPLPPPPPEFGLPPLPEPDPHATTAAASSRARSPTAHLFLILLIGAPEAIRDHQGAAFVETPLGRRWSRRYGGALAQGVSTTDTVAMTESSVEL